MKKIHGLLVDPTECPLIEDLLNKFRVNLNDWDRSKKFDINGNDVIIYNLICDDDTYESIKNVINDSRRKEL